MMIHVSCKIEKVLFGSDETSLALQKPFPSLITKNGSCWLIHVNIANWR